MADAGREQAEWLYEAIIRYLQGPMYTTPLMSFIDNKCVIFDAEDENKLEYTDVHNQFKGLVDGLLGGFLEELGVSAEAFVEVVASSVHNDLNNFVLTSILTIDDFVQFKAMMVKRNIDLTNEVLQMHAKFAGGSSSDAAPPAAPATPEEKEAPPPPPAASEPDAGEEVDDPELAAVLALSRETFEAEQRAAKESEGAAAREAVQESFEAMDAELKAALEMSLKEYEGMLQAERQLDQERVELEQAIAMSLAIEEETKRLLAEEEAMEATEAAAPLAAPEPPAPAPAPALPAPEPTPAPLPVALAPPAPVAAPPKPTPPKPVVAPPAPVAPAAAGAGAGFRRGPGFSSGAGFSSAGATNMQSVREAAALAARTQKNMLVKKDEVVAKQQALSAKMSGADAEQLARAKQAMVAQRSILVAENAKARAEQLESWKADQQAKPPPPPPAGVAAKGALSEEEQNGRRQALQMDLARRLKQELMHKSFAKLDETLGKR